MKSMYDQFGIKVSGPRGSAAIYSEKAYEVSSFLENNHKERVDAARLIGKSRRIDRALDYADKGFSSRSRAGRKVIVLLTAGRTASGSASIRKVADSLRELGVQIFVINVGRRVDSSVFNSLVDSPQDVIKVLPDSLRDTAEIISRKVSEKKGKIFLKFMCP